MSSFQAASSFPFAGPDPSLTIATLIEAQHKNAAALGSANQAAVDGLKTLVQRQSFLLTASVDTYTRVTSDLLAAQSFEERATRQADATRDACVSIFARFRELSDIVIETNVTAMGIMNARIVEAFGELKALFAPPVAATAAPGEAPTPAVVEPAAAREEVAAVDEAIFPVEPDPATVTAAAAPTPEVAVQEAVVTAAPTTAPEAVELEVVAAIAPTIGAETAAPESKVAAPTPPPKKAAPAAKAAVSPVRTAMPKAPPPRPPRRPTSRG